MGANDFSMFFTVTIAPPNRSWTKSKSVSAQLPCSWF